MLSTGYPQEPQALVALRIMESLSEIGIIIGYQMIKLTVSSFTMINTRALVLCYDRNEPTSAYHVHPHEHS